jgi:hypothetical protein
VAPIRTENGVFTFFDSRARTFGTIAADIVEGRAIRTTIEGRTIFRFGGFGPLVSGTGQFTNCAGMMSLNAAISVFPRTLSNLYTFRVSDSAGRLRAIFNRT